MKWDNEKWTKVKSKGFRRFIIYFGIVKLGFIGGVIWLTSSYLIYLRFNLDNVDINDFAKWYLVWLPLLILFGAMGASYLWNENNRKYPG